MKDRDRHARNVTADSAPETAVSNPEILSVPDDERQRFRIYSLCLCESCIGSGKDDNGGRCPNCRGEGRRLHFLTQHDEEAGAATALFQLAMDGEFLDDCAPGLLDRDAPEGKKWPINPWKASARNVSDAARTLAKSRGGRS